jgi:hypothetical protein
MAAKPEEMTIVLQVGMELRITNKGEVIVSNPELELAREDGAADAVLLYRFNPTAGEHSFRLLDPRRGSQAHQSASPRRLGAHFFPRNDSARPRILDISYPSGTKRTIFAF